MYCQCRRACDRSRTTPRRGNVKYVVDGGGRTLVVVVVYDKNETIRYHLLQRPYNIFMSEPILYDVLEEDVLFREPIITVIMRSVPGKPPRVTLNHCLPTVEGATGLKCAGAITTRAREVVFLHFFTLPPVRDVTGTTPTICSRYRQACCNCCDDILRSIARHCNRSLVLLIALGRDYQNCKQLQQTSGI
jgi:hypothetical protein